MVNAPLLPRLPAPAQARLRQIGQGARDLFGKLRDIQEIFDAEVTFLDALAAGGATHPMLGRLLAEVGVARPDGTPLPVGTISGALSRARERAAGGRAAPPASGIILQGRPAQPGSVLPLPADHGTPMPKPARSGRKRPLPAAAHRRPATPCRREPPPPSHSPPPRLRRQNSPFHPPTTGPPPPPAMRGRPPSSTESGADHENFDRD
jgi:hypothetical protein